MISKIGPAACFALPTISISFPPVTILLIANIEHIPACTVCVNMHTGIVK